MVLVLSCRGAADVGKLPRHRRSLLGEDNARQEKRKSRWPCPRLIVRMGAHGKKIRRARRCGCLVRDGVESFGETHEAECVEREANPERRNSDTGLRSTYRTRRGNGVEIVRYCPSPQRWTDGLSSEHWGETDRSTWTMGGPPATGRQRDLELKCEGRMLWERGWRRGGWAEFEVDDRYIPRTEQIC